VVRARPFWPLILTSILLLLLPLGRRVDSGVAGFRGEHFRDGGFRRPPALTTNDSEPSTTAIIRAWSGTPPDTLSADWTGWILIPRDGDYAFATRSDDHSWVLLDGETVIDNPGGAAEVRATRRLSGGMHWLRVRYQQTGGHRGMSLVWDAGRSGELTPIPTWRMRADRVSPWRVRWARAVELIAPVLWWSWAASLLVAVAAALSIPIRALRRELVSHGAGAAFAAVLVVTLVLNVVGIWWGMPSAQGWAPDELLPQGVLDGMGKRFSNGWFSTYPLFHQYLIAVAYLPTLGLEWLRGTAFDLGARHVALVITGRFVSALMAGGTLVAVYLLAADLFGRRAGLFASIVLGLTTPFVFYAKTANVDVPYVFWFAVSLVFYLRLLRTLALRYFVVFAVTATLAVCTKDQAYALYALTPIPVLIALWNARERPGGRWRNLFDLRIAAAVGAAVVTFAIGNNLILNFAGFLDHVDNVLVWSRYAPMFDAGIAGRAALTWFAGVQVKESLGWPSTIAALCGLVLAMRDPTLRFAGWTLVPVASYWLVFLNVIRYSFDRFLLPVCVVAAIFAGFAFARFLATGQWWRRAIAASALAFTVLYTVPVDVMMVADARYTAERWVNERKTREQRIGMLGFNYMPRLPRRSYQVLVTISDLRWFRPTYVIVNADYTRRRPANTTEREALAALDAGELGYRRLFSERSGVPWDWMPGMHPSLIGDRTGPAFSNLEHINPRMEIFVREEN
jgi:hypothetical protein